MHGHAFIRFNTKLCTTLGTWCDVNVQGASPERLNHALTRIKDALLKRNLSDLALYKHVKEYDLGVENIPHKSKELRDTLVKIKQEMSELRLKIDDKIDFDDDHSDEDYSDYDSKKKKSDANVPNIDISYLKPYLQSDGQTTQICQ
ncbi:hypothetical protein DPMN_022119 [Dreissena polymorpha]|uniref:Uncharacterized protein n=1 Tax=Dreissena polymorpha TaxID=45954 RepID=A0A9D4NNC0_DREPO|nr:hypothetical protein DPMN_022119 [Dreissena polymorpha]